MIKFIMIYPVSKDSLSIHLPDLFGNHKDSFSSKIAVLYQNYVARLEETGCCIYAKIKMLISCAVTVQLISAFVLGHFQKKKAPKCDIEGQKST